MWLDKWLGSAAAEAAAAAVEPSSLGRNQREPVNKLAAERGLALGRRPLASSRERSKL